MFSLAVIWIGVKCIAWFGLGIMRNMWPGVWQETVIAVDEVIKITFGIVIIATMEFGRGSSHNNSCHMWMFNTKDMLDSLTA